ncbi:MAG: hypothetical protein M3521_05595 [Acidobacteriota bacterium]|nr:hypothetical protein [Acidobacteriota bacterium]
MTDAPNCTAENPLYFAANITHPSPGEIPLRPSFRGSRNQQENGKSDPKTNAVPVNQSWFLILLGLNCFKERMHLGQVYQLDFQNH